jgi:putative heme transporter
MSTDAEPPAPSSTRPRRPAAPGAGPGRGAPGQRQPPEAGPRPRRGRKALRTAVSAALVATTFGFALPHFASYRSVWTSVHAMAWPQALLVAAAAAASMAAYWFMICSVLPSIRLRQAAAVNLGPNAVANTLPAGGALAMGVSWAMLSSWGVSTAEYVLYTLVSGIWNVFVRLGLPVLALLVLVTVSRPGAGLIAAAAAGLTLLAAAAAGLGLLLRSEPFAVRAGSALQHALVFVCRLVRRPPPCDVPGSLLGFRDRAAGLLAARGWRITATTAASQVALWLVLLACLRGTGLSQAQVPWQTSLAAFAFVGLLTALPITPGGAGITELGLIGILAAGAGHGVGAQVTAAVLLYRAVTYLPPIPLGAAAYLIWQHAPALIRGRPPLIHTSRPNAGPASLRRDRHSRDTAGAAGQPVEMIPSAPGQAPWGRSLAKQ